VLAPKYSKSTFFSRTVHKHVSTDFGFLHIFHSHRLSLLPSTCHRMLRATNASRSTAATSLIHHRTSALGVNQRVLGADRSFATVTSDDLPPTPEHRRLPTAMERMRNFPAGVKQLYKDMLRYKNIHDASRTRLNAWTIRKPLSRDDDGRLPFIILDEELRPGRIPRR
jgi:hypothetical protein